MWSQIHPQLYAYAFTAKGKASAWCPICHVDGGNHTYDCPKLSFPHHFHSASNTSVTPSSLRSSVGLLPRPSPSSRLPLPKRPRVDHCILFNKNKGSCPYGSDCRFEHKCAHCLQLGHPASACPAKTF